MLIRKNGQSLYEFAIVLALVVAAFVSMQVYIKRAMQGRLRDLGDQISTRQYQPGNITSSYVTQEGYQVVDLQQRDTSRRYMGAAPPGEITQGSPDIIVRTGWERAEGQ